MLQSFALAAFALTNTIDIPHIVVLSLIQGVIDAFDLPVRQAMVMEFVERKEHLSNAIALNSSLFNLARLIGPAVAGFVIAGFGAGVCFLVDGFSYLAVLAALLFMRLRKRAVRKVKERPWVEFRQGFHYAFGFAPVRALILLIAAVSATGFSCSVLMPMFARDAFHGRCSTSAGSCRHRAWRRNGALYLGGRKTVRGLGLVITAGGAFMGTALIGFALSRWLPLSLLCLALLGLGGVLLMASSNTLVQTLVDDDKPRS